MINTDEPIVKVVRLDPHASIPSYATSGSAGADVTARTDEPILIPPLGRALVPTGLRIELPSGYEAQVRPRSGLAAKNGVTVLNAPGTIDADYRGEVKIILINFGQEPFVVKDGDRIAQLIVAPVSSARFEETTAVSSSRRGEGGFGSTGI